MMLPLIGCVGVLACEENGLSNGPRTGAVTLMLQVARVATGDELEIRPYYRRTDQSKISFDTTVVALESTTGSQSIPFELDITECLGDSEREGGSSSCPLRISLLLKNLQHEVLDSTEVGPLNVEAGVTTNVTLSPGGVKVIGAAGGTVATADGGATLIIPAGALTQATTIGVRKLTGYPSDTRVTSGTVYQLTPSGLQLAAPATLAIKYNPADVPGGPNRARGLRLSLLNDQGLWGVPGFDRPNLGATTLTAPIPHFSTYGLLVGADILSAGYGSTCRVSASLQASCWGDNQFGQLGDGTRDYHFTPQPVTGGLSFVQVASAYQHACGLTDSGAAYCWGQNSYGELGNGTQVPSASPVAVLGGRTFVKIAVGYFEHSCGLTASGQIYCWGGNFSGAVGTGSTTPSFVLQPTLVTGGHVFTDLALGFDMTCGITNANDLLCWGNGIAGQLGHSLGVLVPTPTPVPGGRKWIGVTGGAAHTCALTTDGKAYCWGQNAAGEVGDPAAPISTPPTFGSATLTAVVGNHTFQSIFATNSASCGIERNGQLYCWGSNFFGELGDGSSAPRATPGLVPLPGPILTLTSGIGHLCAERVTGQILCWGWNATGQLGLGTSGLRFTPSPLLGNLVFSTLAAGSPRCGIVSGSTYCWGTYPGDGTQSASTGPVPVTNGSFAAVASGGSISCGLDTAGAVFCWGLNNAGQFGNGATSSSPNLTPVPAATGQQFSRISVGAVHTCGRSLTGTAYCWGFNGTGEVGDGTTGNQRLTPTAVASQFPLVSVIAGNRTTCGLTAANDAYCWGGVGFGLPFPNTQSPTLVPGGVKFSQITVGNFFACGLEVGTGHAFCVGNNNSGQLGNGSTGSASTTPLPVAGGIVFAELAAGDQHACGRTPVGQVYCWGDRSLGRVGDGPSGSPALQPVLITGITATAIRTGLGSTAATCALTATGQVFCWGDDRNSTLGVAGTQIVSRVPVPLP